MAVYRYLCYQFLFKRNLNTKAMARNILIAEWVLIAGMILSNVTCYNMFGWEKAVYYQFCMDIWHEQIEILHEYKIDDFDDVMYKILRFTPAVIGHLFIPLELFIYMRIIYHLWKHDKENFQHKIITESTRQERNRKNVITLKGQVICFVIEMAFAIYLFIHTANFSFAEASVMPISLIIGSTIISIVQISSSHEMMRFIKRHFPFV